MESILLAAGHQHERCPTSPYSPTIYAGEPLVLLGKGDELSGRLVIRGMIGDRPWTQTVFLDKASDSPSVARLWANRRIADVEAQRWSGQIKGEAADSAIAQLGLAYTLVTTKTSLVAVDDTPARPAGAMLTKEDLPLLLPKGWDFDTLLGNTAPATTAAAPPPYQMEKMELPQTATGFLGTIYKGLAMLALGLLGFGAVRRRRVRGGSL